jgi:hypothetical protein
MNADEEVTPADLREAKKYLLEGSEAERLAFAQRQLAARRRVDRLIQFYGRYPCRMARIHMLTASSVAVGRFCGISRSFDAIGEGIMPVDRDGQPRSLPWKTYQDACAANRPWTLRDELWLEAHALDWQAVRTAGLDADFFAEAAPHGDETPWRLLRRHAELTFGTRVFDHLSGQGLVPLETTISLSIGLSLRRSFRHGGPLIGRFLAEALHGVFLSPREARLGVPSYRRIGATVLRSIVSSAGAWKVYRRGIRLRNRGVCCPEGEWPLLETLLGEAVAQVHPLIVQFYRNPGRFNALSSLDILTLPLMTYSWLAALLLGQGLYEGGPGPIPTRLRVFRREDGSMHFVRELYCGPALRVFDSDFVLREVAGKPELVEVFRDIGVEVVLDAELRPGGGVAVVGRDIYWRGVRLPRTALRVEFASTVCSGPDGDESIEIIGRLSMQPRTAIGRFVMHGLLRRPRELGKIRYEVRTAGPDLLDESLPPGPKDRGN